MTDTDAATIAALLGELREVDEETFILLDDIDSMINWKAPNAPEGHRHPLDELVLNSVVQGCIQRAIEARGWEYVVSYDREARQPYGQIGIPISNVRIEYQHRNYADTPAAAILAAYIEAVRASK